MPSGTKGTVRYVDDAALVGVAWDNGRSLSLIPGVDSFRKLTQVEKLTNDNSELRTQMVSVMSASITNQNRNQVFLGIGEAWLKNAKRRR